MLFKKMQVMIRRSKVCASDLNLGSHNTLLDEAPYCRPRCSYDRTSEFSILRLADRTLVHHIAFF